MELPLILYNDNHLFSPQEATCDKCKFFYRFISVPTLHSAGRILGFQSSHCITRLPYTRYRLISFLHQIHVVGKTLAFTSIKFTNSKDEIVARGSHTK